MIACLLGVQARPILRPGPDDLVAIQAVFNIHNGLTPAMGHKGMLASTSCHLDWADVVYMMGHFNCRCSKPHARENSSDHSGDYRVGCTDIILLYEAVMLSAGGGGLRAVAHGVWMACRWRVGHTTTWTLHRATLC